MKLSTVLLVAFAASPACAAVQNEKVATLERTLKPGESTSVSVGPAVVVYFNDGSVELLRRGGANERTSVKRGDTVFQPAGGTEMKNAGASDLKFVRAEFLTEGDSETWGRNGLAPNYKLLFENQLARVYDIRIAAGEREPQHTHHPRVVVCLSGAILKHLMPDGREEPSTLKTGEVVWRQGGTHIGQNLGPTNLWVIAIEPK